MTYACPPGTNSSFCKSKRKSNSAKITYCSAAQINCTLNKKTFYTDCLGFNAGCKVYDFVGGKYVPVGDGFYSDGTKSYYINNGVVGSLGQTCPRFFLLDWIKDCNIGENLPGTWYVTAVDDNTFVPATNVVYHIPIPIVQVDACTTSPQSYWSIRVQNTTPVYDIGDNSYIESVVGDFTDTFKLPGFLQNRCNTRQIT